MLGVLGWLAGDADQDAISIELGMKSQLAGLGCQKPDLRRGRATEREPYDESDVPICHMSQGL